MLNDCTTTVNGTDFCIPQKGTATKGNSFASHKYAGKSALRYKLGADILVGNLVWIQGPYPAGKYTDIKIFNKILRNFLEPGERVEADEGYRGHPDKIKCPGNDANPAENLGMHGEGKGTSRDAKWAAEELGDPSPGRPSPHLAPRRCVPGVRGHHAAHHRER